MGVAQHCFEKMMVLHADMQAASTKHVCSFDMFLPGPNLGGPSLINTPVSSKIEQQDILMFGCLGKNAKLGNRPTFHHYANGKMPSWAIDQHFLGVV